VVDLREGAEGARRARPDHAHVSAGALREALVPAFKIGIDGEARKEWARSHAIHKVPIHTSAKRMRALARIVKAIPNALKGME
jgi:hypothetical protein